MVHNLKMKTTLCFVVVMWSILTCASKHRHYFSNKFSRNSPWLSRFSKPESREVYAINVDHYSNYSNWSSCLQRECIEVRYRLCLDDSWKAAPKYSRFNYKRCMSKYLVETRSCQNATQCSVHTGSQTISNFTSTCGFRKSSDNQIEMKILGGQPAIPHTWPWVVRLSYRMSDKHDSVSFCGGTVIAPNWILTAAHCVLVETKSIPVGKVVQLNKHMKGTIGVHFGDHDKSVKESGESYQDVEIAILHPLYHRIMQTDGYDIALLKLNTPVEMSSQISHACLPPPDLEITPGTKCYALGWGKNTGPVKSRHVSLDRLMDSIMSSTFNLFHLVPNHHHRWQWKKRTGRKVENDVNELHQVELPIVSIKQCARHYHDVNPKLHVCAGQRDKDTCAGDSGGGLYCQLPQSKQWFVIGVTSFGMARGCGLNPGVYTNTASHMEWIFKVIGSTNADSE